MILGVIVLFIYIAMFAYDRCAIRYICASAAADAVYEPDPAFAAEEYAAERLSGRLILDWDTGIRTEDDEEHVILTVEAALPLFGRTFTYTEKAYKHFCPKY